MRLQLHVPFPLWAKVQVELNRIESLEVISPVDQPTPWCAGRVIASKQNRTCVDLKPLNASVQREFPPPLPTVDDTLAQLTGAKIFSGLNANSGFWQIPLSPSSKLFTTFLTQNGCYCFNKLPFGISYAPEHFQKRMSNLLTDIPGVLCHLDDVLVFGSNWIEHDSRLTQVLHRIQSAGATLNKDKYQFGKSSIKFLGQIIDGNGISPDPVKTSAIVNMKPPTNASELQHYMATINQFGKFSPKLAEVTQPLCELL